MAIDVKDLAGDVRVYGSGSPGGKGAGLIRINAVSIPEVEHLKTRILATDFYDRYVDNGGAIPRSDLSEIVSLLGEFEAGPLGIRSSATNEACSSPEGAGPVHAGENVSFMLPNNHPEPRARAVQAILAIGHIYDDFRRRQPPGGREKMAIVINPIPGLFDDTLAGPVYYPYVSGVASSYFPHALRNQDPREGFARIAFGHGYAAVLDDFPVISMATIRNPIPPDLLRIGRGQQYFYALDLTRNEGLEGKELETMRKLHVRFANYHKIRLLGLQRESVTIEELIQNDRFDFKTGLTRIMETIAARLASHFQIEFVFNLDFSRKEDRRGAFHIVQLTELPELKLKTLPRPRSVRHTYLSVANAQGHGIKRGIRSAVVVSPFVYTPDKQAAVRRQMADVNREMKARGERYVLVVPGRLGSRNPEWGIFVDFKDVDQAAAIFEYGVDIAGRAEPLPEDGSVTGGIYGSHFLYVIQGGFDEEQKRLQTRMYGTQGTHFLTNLISNNIIYGYIEPQRDTFDPWFFSGARSDSGLAVAAFPRRVTVYADSVRQRCQVVSEA